MPLDQAVVDLGIEPSQDAVTVLHDSLRHLFHRLAARSDGPAVSAIEDELPPVSGRTGVDLLQGKAAIGACRKSRHDLPRGVQDPCLEFEWLGHGQEMKKCELENVPRRGAATVTGPSGPSSCALCLFH